MFPIQDTIPSRTVPIVNWLLIMLNVLVFLFELTVPKDQIEAFFRVYALVPAKVSSGEIDSFYPFITNMFLHGGWGHLIGNMWTLYIFGDNVEDRMGHGKYLLFYLLCGIAASGTHYFLYSHSDVPALGASGAISGVMGAYMFLFPYSRIIFLIPIFFMPYFVEISAFFYLFMWFVGQLFSGTFSLMLTNQAVGIAFWAHIGGFIFGMLTYKIFASRKYPEDRHADQYYLKYKNYY